MQKIIEFIRNIYKTEDFLPLHEPRFLGNEKKYLNECIDSSYVSSVGKFVNIFEEKFAKKVGSKYAIATVNATAALHLALLVAGVSKDDEVITQALSFVATPNAISYTGAKPIFIDVDLDTLGMSPEALKNFLEKNCEVIDGVCKNKTTKKIVKAVVPMHTFGHPCKIQTIAEICESYHLTLIEDAAESLGSYYKAKHTGSFGKLGVFSFNGNKIITSGGGGVIVTDDAELAQKAKHLSSTAKKPHAWEYIHDELGFNYRMPNLNAALLVAQLEQLDDFLKAKRLLAQKYKNFFEYSSDISFILEPESAESNYWLQALLFKNKLERDAFLEYTNKNGIMTRAIWRLMNDLEMYKNCQCDSLKNSIYLQQRVVNITSSVVV